MAETNGIASDASPHETVPLPQTVTQTQTPPPSQPATTSIDPTFPVNSLTDPGLRKRPRDARIIHMIVANLGVNAYQERVPLQLMDFAYRYTSSTLQDALHFTSENYTTSTNAPPGKVAANHDSNAITIPSLRLSIGSRTHYQFNPGLPKEYFQELAQEKNRITLPIVTRDNGLRLPPEKYCLTGVGFGLKEEWDSEGEEYLREGEQIVDVVMAEEGGGENGDDEDDERMEDVFGESYEGKGTEEERSISR